MAETNTTNGKPPSDEAKKLVGASYADRAVAALPDGRMYGKDILKLLGEYDPDHVSLQDMRRMQDDPAVKMAFYYGKAPLVTADYDIQCEDPRIRAAALENYGEIHVPFMKIALNSWDFGYQGAIKQFEYGKLYATYEDPDSGEVKPVWPDSGVDPVLMGVPIPLPPEVTEPHLKKGRFAGIRTSLARLSGQEPTGEDHDVVPPEWSLWFAHLFEETFRNYYGRSRLVPVYKPWYSYWGNWYNRDRHADQDADPPLQIWYPTGDSRVPDPSNPGQTIKISNREVAEAIGPALRNGATIVWPSDVHIAEDGKLSVQKKWEAAYLQGGDNLAVFNDLLDRLEVAKFRACMVPEQALIEAIKGSGARNVAATQADLFTMSLEIEAVTLDRIRNEYYLKPWVEANFGSDAPPCKLVTTGFSEEDLSLATELITIAFNADPNALPIKFEEMLERAGIPQYTKKEQEEREEAIAEAQAAQAEAEAAAQPVGPLPGEPAQPVAGPDAQALSAAQEHRRTAPRPYDPPGRINLDVGRAPTWARKEGARRDANVAAVAERLREVVLARYQDVFEAAADAVADAEASSADLSLARRGGLIGRGGLASRLVGKVAKAVDDKVAGYVNALTDEMASMYHAAGAAELIRLGMDTDSWDVGRAEVQDWASENAGRLITTMDKTVVDQHVRPWLERVLADDVYRPDFVEGGSGIPISSVELAAQLTDHFSAYPEWMAERVVRTEAMTGYNLSAADMWERVGVTEVQEFDGLGGRTGKTDEECLARNGKVVTIDQFRIDTHDEHPNGTLGARPVLTSVRLRRLEPALVYADARRSGSHYAIQDDGLILSVEETGRLLAES